MGTRRVPVLLVIDKKEVSHLAKRILPWVLIALDVDGEAAENRIRNQ